MNQPIKIIFAGTPEFAVPFLQSLFSDDAFEVVGVITQPDKPVGRKHQLTASPIKLLAKEKNTTLWQPDKIIEIKDELTALAPDFLVVVAFGQIIPPEILAIASKGNINVHPSLLPKYRGASPIQSAILNGDGQSGVTIMLMDQKMDHGPILTQIPCELSGQETGESLHRQMAVIGPPLLAQTIKDYQAGQIRPKEQDHQQAVFCPIIKKTAGKIDWHGPAQAIARQIRAFHSWPGTWTVWEEKRLKILPTATTVETSTNGDQPGTVKELNGQLMVVCGQNALKLDQLQLEGKKAVSATEFLRGNQSIIGTILK